VPCGYVVGGCRVWPRHPTVVRGRGRSLVSWNCHWQYLKKCRTITISIRNKEIEKTYYWPRRRVLSFGPVIPTSVISIHHWLSIVHSCHPKKKEHEKKRTDDPRHVTTTCLGPYLIEKHIDGPRHALTCPCPNRGL